MTTAANQGPSLSVAQRGCIAACIACRDACEQAAAHFIQTRGEAEDAPPVALLRECMARCDETIAAVRAGGDACGPATEAAREIAARTMKALIEHSSGDATVEACIEACRRCAASCMEAEAPAVDQDKVSADSFPASDPPAH